MHTWLYHPPSYLSILLIASEFQLCILYHMQHTCKCLITSKIKTYVLRMILQTFNNVAECILHSRFSNLEISVKQLAYIVL